MSHRSASPIVNDHRGAIDVIDTPDWSSESNYWLDAETDESK